MVFLPFEESSYAAFAKLASGLFKIIINKLCFEALQVNDKIMLLFVSEKSVEAVSQLKNSLIGSLKLILLIGSFFLFHLPPRLEAQ
jgi:hypothetical protein